MCANPEKYVVLVEMVIPAESEDAAKAEVEQHLELAYSELYPIEWTITGVRKVD